MSRPAPTADWVTIPDLYRDPFPVYERLRAEGGVHWVPAVGRYLITSYEAVHATEVDQQTFSADEEGSLQIRAMGHSMLRRDDPEHHIERRAWQPALRPGVVKRTWTSVFRDNAAVELERLVEKGPGADLIRDFAAPYAAENLRMLLGFYNVRQEDLQRWSQTMIDATGNYADDADVWAAGERSFHEVDDALDEMLSWHAKHRDDSLISALLSMPGEQMPLAKIRANMKMTIGGGLNEPRDALGVAAWAMLTHPEQRRLVAADSSRWSTVFDESIRWVAPIGMYSRQTTREVELARTSLPAGARLGICILSANRDESVWADAHRFDIRREVHPHLAFSKGVHVCLGAAAARAAVAEVGLPMLFDRLAGLSLVPDDPPEVGGWVFRGMLRLPVSWEHTRESRSADAADAAPRIAVVGSGPAGCFTAAALRKTLPESELDVYDRLPVPYGLVRYGVAADHQGTKSVSRQFERLFRREGVRFHGSSPIGSDVTLADLRGAFDAVVLATGLRADAGLDVPGADLDGVVGAGRLTRVLNGHPDEGGLAPLGRQVALVGNGNVAMDVVRLVVKDAAGFDESDIDDETRDRLVGDVEVVHVVGRSLPDSAKFDPVMVRQLAGIPGVQHVVHTTAGDDVEAGKDARWDAVRELVDGQPEARPRVRVEWWFGATPVAVEGPDVGDHLSGLRIRADGHETSLDVDTVVTAIGFAADDQTPVVPGQHPDGRVEPGLYVAGWLRRGPRGTIPDQRNDARSLARLVAEDVAAGLVGTGAAGLEPGAGEVDFDGWRRIDLREALGAAPGRKRAKLRTHGELVAAATDDTLVLPDDSDDATASGGHGSLPVTVHFGTESGGAEMVADELRHHLAGRADVKVSDLGDETPGDLDPTRLHLVVCSTYGDGEVPTSGRDFHSALQSGSDDLSGVRYAVFGMGDRSYAKTYSRGSELLDEALEARGARRIGEYGRHDAGGAVDAGELAAEWVDGVLAEAEAELGSGARATT